MSPEPGFLWEAQWKTPFIHVPQVVASVLTGWMRDFPISCCTFVLGEIDPWPVAQGTALV